MRSQDRPMGIEEPLYVYQFSTEPKYTKYIYIAPIVVWASKNGDSFKSTLIIIIIRTETQYTLSLTLNSNINQV